MSQNFDLDLSFLSYVKKGVTFGHFLKRFFSRLHKTKTKT